MIIVSYTVDDAANVISDSGTTVFRLTDYIKPFEVANITVNGNRQYGTNVTVNATGTGFVTAAYRIYYTNGEYAPYITTVSDVPTPGAGWIDSGKAGTMIVSSSSNASVVIPGSNFADNNWTYVTIKVAASSSTGVWTWKYSPVYGLGNPPVLSEGGYLSSIRHNQVIRPFGTTKDIVVSSPDNPVEYSGMTYTEAQNLLLGNNTFIDRDLLKYRLEFNADKPNDIKDLKVYINFNWNYEDGVEIRMTKASLYKKNSTGSPLLLKDLTTLINRESAHSKNHYIISLGNENTVDPNIPPQPMIKANGPGEYFMEYEAILYVMPTYTEIVAEVVNLAEVRVCLANDAEVTEPSGPSNKFDIQTNVMVRPVKYE